MDDHRDGLAAAAQVHAIAHEHGVAADELGHAVADRDQQLSGPPKKLVSAGHRRVLAEN
jgi:hypothetical protein